MAAGSAKKQCNCMIFNIKRIKRSNDVVAKLRCPLHLSAQRALLSKDETHDGIRNGVFLYKNLYAVKNYKWGMKAPFFKPFHQGNILMYHPVSVGMSFSQNEEPFLILFLTQVNVPGED